MKCDITIMCIDIMSYYTVLNKEDILNIIWNFRNLLLIQHIPKKIRYSITNSEYILQKVKHSLYHSKMCSQAILKIQSWHSNRLWFSFANAYILFKIKTEIYLKKKYLDLHFFQTRCIVKICTFPPCFYLQNIQYKTKFHKLLSMHFI